MTGRRRPAGSPTRGKTAPNRLRATDAYLALAHPALVRRLPGPYVDLGFGGSPVTSVETFRRLRRLDPAFRLVGVEIDPGRVAAAAAFAEPGLEFRLGGFDLPLGPGERAGVVRAFNVLRQYAEREVGGALALLGAQMAVGGLLLEGTSDPLGRLVAFQVLRRAPDGALAREAVVLAPRLRADFSPRRFQAVLPKCFIHHAEPGGAIDGFFGAWDAAWASQRWPDLRRRFAATADVLVERHGHRVDRRPGLLRRGFLVLEGEWPHRLGRELGRPRPSCPSRGRAIVAATSATGGAEGVSLEPPRRR